MGLFVFKCAECGTKMEVIQKFEDPEPVCGCGYVMKRQIAPVNFSLSGGGWYKDGYTKPKSAEPSPESKIAENI
jgi:putative FmdB family regulatory protein